MAKNEALTVIDKELSRPDIARAVKEAMTLKMRYDVIKISDQSEYDQAGKEMQGVKANLEEMEGFQLDLTKPLNDDLKRVRDFFRIPLSYLDAAKKSISAARVSYTQKMEEKRQEDERKLRELARKEEEKKKAALEARALKAEEKGKEEKAEELREQAKEVFVPVPIIESRVEKTAGIGRRKDWKYRILDSMAIPRDFLCVDEKKIGQYARTMKEMAKCPGVEFYFVETEITGKTDQDIWGRNDNKIGGK
jgi:hypothetical protein